MKRIIFLLLCSALTCSAQYWPRPERFEGAIAEFEKQDATKMPPEGAVLCIGSSSMAKWHNRIQNDLAPLTVIPRGFGGSVIRDVIHFADRVVFPYNPRAILLYEGDNDIAAKITPERVADKFGDFFDLVHSRLPETCIYVISIKPSVARQHLWPAMQEANTLIKALCEQDERLTFIDASSALLNEDGSPRTDVLVGDNLHMNDAGYDIWTGIIRPVLMEKEAAFED